MRVSTIAAALIFASIGTLNLISPAKATQVYKENFNNSPMPPPDWTMNPNPPELPNGDYVWGLTNAKSICLSDVKMGRSLRQEKTGTSSHGGSANLTYDIALASAIGTGGSETTIMMSAAFCYNNNGIAPSTGNNFFCWTLTGEPSEFRICLSEGYDLAAIVGGSGGFSIGSAAAYEKQWITLTIYYTLGRPTAIAVVNAGGTANAHTVDLTIMKPDPSNPKNVLTVPYTFTSATSSNLSATLNFDTPQTGAIYIDNMLLRFLRKNRTCSDLNNLSALGNAVTVARTEAGC